MTRWISRLNDALGLVVPWMVVVIVVLEISIVVLRYVYSVTYPALSDLVQYLHAITFMTLAGYVLRRDGHVRVDIFYSRARKSRRAVIDAVGTVLLLWPFSLYILWSSWPYVRESWKILEGAPTPSGLQAIFVLKSFLLVFPVVLFLQGVVVVGHALVARAQSSATDPYRG
jgi:TRAP-type mannitol/chloroaromatic compound transport system permease small subunit